MSAARPLRAVAAALMVAAGISGCAPSMPSDPLGPRPVVGPPPAFTPAAPEIFRTANGMTVWLFERHTLPLVAVTLAVPYGSASDPPGQAGLAHVTADMIDEGAGARSAIDLSTAVNGLGASLATEAGLDGSWVSCSVLKKNLAPMLSIFGDVVGRPRFDAADWARVSGLWKNDLEQRAQDPAAVARIAMAAALYGPGSPYGHPTAGLTESARRVDLDAVKGFYAMHYRPDRSTLVVAGDVTRAELAPLLDAALDGWKAGDGPAPAEPVVSPSPSPPRLVLVDRPDAPQSVIAVVRQGVAASDPRAPLLDLVNTALGGSFTSRLNEDLREEHGWSYGAGSAFGEARGTGAFVARASVVTASTGDALRAMLGELDKMAAGGPTADEVAKAKAQDRTDRVEGYESVGAIAGRLGTLAALGLGPDHDAQASRARQQATQAQIDKLSGAVSPGGATIVVVGPRALVTPELAKAGLGAPEIWDAEGHPINAANGL